MLSVAHLVDRRLHTDRKVTFWYGARSLREAFYIEDFDLGVEPENILFDDFG